MLFRSASQEQTKIALAQAKIGETRVKEKEVAIDAANHAADRRSKEMLAKIDLEQSMLVHQDKLAHQTRQSAQDAMFKQGDMQNQMRQSQQDDEFRRQEAEYKRQQESQKPEGSGS